MCVDTGCWYAVGVIGEAGLVVRMTNSEQDGYSPGYVTGGTGVADSAV